MKRPHCAKSVEFRKLLRRRWFNRLVDRAGVRQIRPHDIRHTYVTLARDHGVDSKILTDRVGHANENVTKQIYTHRSVGCVEVSAKINDPLWIRGPAPEAPKDRSQQKPSGRGPRLACEKDSAGICRDDA